MRHIQLRLLQESFQINPQHATLYNLYTEEVISPGYIISRWLVWSNIKRRLSNSMLPTKAYRDHIKYLGDQMYKIKYIKEI